MTKHAYEKTLKEMEADASGGDARATFRLARIVMHGFRGAKADPKRALALLEKAAAAGSAAAAYELGDRAYRGSGVPEDEASARRWWTRAAELGDINAMSNLFSDDAEDAETQKWIVKAAAGGQPHAKERLKELLSGKKVNRASLASFAARSLEDLAAESEDETMSESFELVGKKDVINVVLGKWIARVEAAWPDLVVTATCDGATIDLPGPDAPKEIDHEDGVKLSLACAGRELECELRYDADEKTWSFEISATQPVPDEETRGVIVRGLEAEAKAAKVKITH